MSTYDFHICSYTGWLIYTYEKLEDARGFLEDTKFSDYEISKSNLAIYERSDDPNDSDIECLVEALEGADMFKILDLAEGYKTLDWSQEKVVF